MPGAIDQGRPVRWRQLKGVAASVLGSSAVGRLVKWTHPRWIPSRGLRLRNGDAVSASAAATLYFGMYENGERRFVEQYLDPDVDVIEVGASIGVMSCNIGRKLGPGRKLVCVEANSKLVGYVRENLARNCPHLRPAVVEAAVDYQSVTGTTRFAASDYHLESALSNSGELELPAVTLRKLCDEHGIDRFTLVADIEGAEAGIAFAAPDELARCGRIIIELHATRFAGQELSLDDLIRLFGDRHGYTLADRYGRVCVLDRTAARAP
jgi:FkbM family methyltransferase